MRAISMDLRERVARAKGTGSSYEVAARFDVHDSWVRRIWLRLAATGSVAPRPLAATARGKSTLQARL
jgi:transposase